MTDEILQPNQPVKFQSRNMRPKFRRLRAGDIFLIEYEVEEAVWNQLRTVPEDAIIENVTWFHDGDGPTTDSILAAETITKATKDNGKPEKGIYGGYWQQMFKQGFNNFPDLVAVLECESKNVRTVLRDVFHTESLTHIGPQIFNKWAESQQLHSLVTLSRNAEQQAARNESKP